MGGRISEGQSRSESNPAVNTLALQRIQGSIKLSYLLSLKLLVDNTTILHFRTWSNSDTRLSTSLLGKHHSQITMKAQELRKRAPEITTKKGSKGQSCKSRKTNRPTRTREEIEAFRAKCQQDPVLAGNILRTLKHYTKQWCKSSPLVPTKDDGPPQVSYGGYNHFALLSDVVLWSQGIDTNDKGGGQNLQASHLCDNSTCMDPEHIIVETAIQNNSRKNCGFVQRCGHDGCGKLVYCCRHEPRCISYVENFNSFKE